MANNYQSLNLKSEYVSGVDDIPNEFYLPIFKMTKYYRRAVGFFSTSALTKLTLGFRSLIKNDAKIEFIVSPQLTSDDIQQIELGYQLRDIVEKRIIKDFDVALSEDDQKKISLITMLIQRGNLDIKVAVLRNRSGIFHVKFGIMEDFEGNLIAYSGSLNDSRTAYDLNFENFDVYCSWQGIESQNRINNKQKNFSKLWENEVDVLEVIDFPSAAKEKLLKIRERYSDSDFDEFLGEVEETKGEYLSENEFKSGFEKPKLREYQLEAVSEWKKNEYRGIFEMATGTGKTRTAIGGLYDLYNEKHRLFVIIVVPYQHLVEQWADDLRLFKINPIIGYSNNDYHDFLKRLNSAKADYHLGVLDFVCFVTTIGTFRTNKVQSLINQDNNDYLLIVDEAHNVGTESIQQRLYNFKYRLALSATLDRHNDPEGTEFIRSYFGETCIDYGLEIAIKEGALCPYKYYPIITTLNSEELEKYYELSKEIAKCIRKDGKGRVIQTTKAKYLLLARARLVAGSKDKLEKLLEKITDYRNEFGSLIYCGATNMQDDDLDSEIRQIDLVSMKIWENLGITNSQFTSRENKDQRGQIINNFIEKNTQVIVAIKCLDEGVNIPSIKTAFIIASTTNPKEYIQRRGRVLRPSSNKEFAEIYDFVTLPRNLESTHLLGSEVLHNDLGLIRRELDRIVEFSKLSMNKYEGDNLIYKIRQVYGNMLTNEGAEVKVYDEG